MQRWVRENYGDQDNFDFYAVNIGENRDLVAEYVEQIGLEIPVILGSNQLFDQYRLRGGVSPYPVDYVIDDEGVIRYANHEYEPEIILMVIDRLLDIGNDLELQFYTEVTETDYCHDLQITSLSVEGEPVPTGWEIGVFTPDSLLAGAIVWSADHEQTITLSAYGDDPETDEVEGFLDEESFIFQVWDNDTDTEWVTIEVEFDDGPEHWQEDGISVLSLNCIEPEKINEKPAAPSDFYLSEAYPNPFNSVTRVVFGLPVSSDVVISVFNLEGRHVSRLVKEQFQQGHHTVEWNTGDLPAGTYVIRMETGMHSFVRKVLLLK